LFFPDKETMKTKFSDKLFKKAQKLIPGGVNSPVRAFKSVGRTPLFIKKAKGAYLWDADGNKFIDYVGSWGPMILGHAHPRILHAIRKATSSGTSFGAPTELEVKMAEVITRIIPSIEMVRMVNSGTEATMSAIRLARAYTGREKIIKFEGCYHGHGDSFLIKAGSGAMTLGVPDSPGVPAAIAAGTLNARYNDLASVNQLVSQHSNSIAAIIVEPIVGNMGCIPPAPGFLEGLRSICDSNKIVLIFDEVMTGFRVALGGAQQLYGVRPDLTTLGKIIGGGLPVGAYGGKKEIMHMVAPSGPMYQAGTLSGNPLAMAAGYEMLRLLSSNKSTYARLERTGAILEAGIREILADLNLQYQINRVGSMFTLFFTNHPVVDYNSAKTSNTTLFAGYFKKMLEHGIYLKRRSFPQATLLLSSRKLFARFDLHFNLPFSKNSKAALRTRKAAL
jgi:glutamate-1-semialdehyde 2,1-aminomutase